MFETDFTAAVAKEHINELKNLRDSIEVERVAKQEANQTPAIARIRRLFKRS